MPRRDIFKDGVETRFKRQGDLPGDIPLADKTFGVRLPADIDQAIRALPEPTAWVRQVIIRAASGELLGASPAVNPGTEPLADADSGDTGPAEDLLGTAPPPDVGIPPVAGRQTWLPGIVPDGITHDELIGAVDQLLAVPRLPKPAREKLQNLRDRLSEGGCDSL